MGIVKRNLELEDYLNSEEAEWRLLSDSEFKHISRHLTEFLSSDNFNSYSGDSAFEKLKNHLPFSGYIYNAPNNSILSIGYNNTFAYEINSLKTLNRVKLNHIECVFSNKSLSFACALNHEWQAMCPELYIEKFV